MCSTSQTEKKFSVVQTIFCINPRYLEEGLEEAARRMPREEFSAIEIGGLGWPPEDVSYSPAVLAAHTWIESLALHSQLQPHEDEIHLLAQLTNLKTLSWKASKPFNYASFQKLEKLNIIGCSSVEGLDQVHSLKQLRIDWKGTSLPDEFALLTVEDLSLSSKELVDISAMFKMKQLKYLLLGDMPKLQVGPEEIHLDCLEKLFLGNANWSDLSQLHSKSLRKLAFMGCIPIRSLEFISQCPQLREIYVKSCEARDMKPALEHPMLEQVFFLDGETHHFHRGRG